MHHQECDVYEANSFGSIPSCKWLKYTYTLNKDFIDYWDNKPSCRCSSSPYDRQSTTCDCRNRKELDCFCRKKHCCNCSCHQNIASGYCCADDRFLIKNHYNFNKNQTNVGNRIKYLNHLGCGPTNSKSVRCHSHARNEEQKHSRCCHPRYHNCDQSVDECFLQNSCRACVGTAEDLIVNSLQGHHCCKKAVSFCDDVIYLTKPTKICTNRTPQQCNHAKLRQLAGGAWLSQCEDDGTLNLELEFNKICLCGGPDNQPCTKGNISEESKPTSSSVANGENDSKSGQSVRWTKSGQYSCSLEEKASTEISCCDGSDLPYSSRGSCSQTRDSRPSSNSQKSIGSKCQQTVPSSSTKSNATTNSVASAKTYSSYSRNTGSSKKLDDEQLDRHSIKSNASANSSGSNVIPKGTSRNSRSSRKVDNEESDRRSTKDNELSNSVASSKNNKRSSRNSRSSKKLDNDQNDRRSINSNVSENSAVSNKIPNSYGSKKLDNGQPDSHSIQSNPSASSTPSSKIRNSTARTSQSSKKSNNEQQNRRKSNASSAASAKTYDSSSKNNRSNKAFFSDQPDYHSTKNDTLSNSVASTKTYNSSSKNSCSSKKTDNEQSDNHSTKSDVSPKIVNSSSKSNRSSKKTNNEQNDHHSTKSDIAPKTNNSSSKNFRTKKKTDNEQLNSSRDRPSKEEVKKIKKKLKLLRTLDDSLAPKSTGYQTTTLATCAVKHFHEHNSTGFSPFTGTDSTKKSKKAKNLPATASTSYCFSPHDMSKSKSSKGSKAVKLADPLDSYFVFVKSKPAQSINDQSLIDDKINKRNVTKYCTCDDMASNLVHLLDLPQILEKQHRKSTGNNYALTTHLNINEVNIPPQKKLFLGQYSDDRNFDVTSKYLTSYFNKKSSHSEKTPKCFSGSISKYVNFLLEKVDEVRFQDLEESQCLFCGTISSRDLIPSPEISTTGCYLVSPRTKLMQ